MTDPLISIVMPVKNGEEFIGQTIESALGQDFADFELIIVNDSSTDRTVDVVNSFQDSRIRLTDLPAGQSGIVAGLNFGILISRGDLIARMDADDLMVDGRLRTQYAYMKKHQELAMCGSQAFKIGMARGSIKVPQSASHILASSLFRNPFIHPTIMFRRRVFEEQGFRYEEGFDLAEDYRLWTLVIQQCEARNLKQKLLGYRVHRSQLSTSSLPRRMDSLRRILIDQLSRMGISLNKDDIEIHLQANSDVFYFARQKGNFGKLMKWNFWLAKSIAKSGQVSNFWISWEMTQRTIKLVAAQILVKFRLREI